MFFSDYADFDGIVNFRSNLTVLNSAETGWHTWATRSGGNYNLSVGTISSGAITSNASMTLSGNGTELLFSGGNNRIKFSGYRALEGNTTGTTLQLAEGYGSTTVQSHLNMQSGYEIRHAGTTVIDSSRNVTANSLTVSNGSVFSDSNFAFLTTGSGAQNIRTKSVFAGTSYNDTPPAGSFNATNTYELNGTTVIDASRNITNAGTITAGAY